MSAVIAANGWGWRHAARQRPAVADLSFRIEAGERVLLLGPSGAGKSTVLAGLAGVLGDAEDGDEVGALTIDGAHPTTQRGRAGLVLQDPQANTILSRVGDDVAFGLENLRVSTDEIWPRVRQALAAVGLQCSLDHPTSALSGGERQRLALAGVIAMQPDVLLLDEPTANLDQTGVIEVRDAVEASLAATGATLVVVEHRVDVWLPIIDRVIVLEPGGGVMADGTPDDVLGRHADALAAQGVWVPGHRIDVQRSPAPGDTLLEARELSVGRNSRAVQRQISHALHAGESTVVLGPNGAGKSTFALTLASLLPPISGDVVASESLRGGLQASPHAWRARDLAERIGTVFQDPEHQFVATTVRDELLVGLRRSRLSAAVQRERVDRVLEQLRLDRLALAHPFTLSGGEQRRLSVGTALVTEPRVLVLDEPTFGQDRTTWKELVTMMAGLVEEGTAMVTVTHDADVARVLGDRVLQFEAIE